MFGLGKKSPDKASSSWSERLRAGLARTREAIGGGFSTLLGRRVVDEALFEEIETALLAADCGVDVTEAIVAELRQRARRDKVEEGSTLRGVLRAILLERTRVLEHPLDVSVAKPFVIMIAGVNGSGKTTSIGKLAKHFQAEGRSVLLAAGDTFRAAAREQLAVWGERNGIAVISQQSGDAAAVVFDAVNAARARGIDVVIADTAGRLPTQLHLMEEIAKVRRVIGKAMTGAPHEVLLVIDAGTGQNAITQVRAFDSAVGVTGLVLTKLDGSAKGGVLLAAAHARAEAASGTKRAGAGARTTPSGSATDPIPVRFIGVGEGIDDLRPFSAREFVEALVD